MTEKALASLAHDISFAVFRVAELVEHLFLKKELERAAVELAAYIDEEAISMMERLVSLGVAIGEINDTNGAVLKREIGNLRQLLDQEEWRDEEDVDITGIFSGKETEAKLKRQVNGNVNGKSTSPSKRQTEILQFIRQFPNGCRMADLARNFEEVSKRTLRNDITALIDSNLVERVGERGPYSFVKAVKVSEGPYNPELDLEESTEAGQAVIFLNEPRD